MANSQVPEETMDVPTRELCVIEICVKYLGQKKGQRNGGKRYISEY